MDPEDHWFDMPEFVQGSKAAVKRVWLNFETEDDMEEFNKVTGLNITMKTKGVFYPIRKSKKIVYKDGD